MNVLWVRAGSPVSLSDIPRLTPEDFRRVCVEVSRKSGRLSALLFRPQVGEKPAKSGEILGILADDFNQRIGLLVATLEGRSYPSLSSELPQAQAFERELFEAHGIEPEGHPWLKPLRRHRDLEGDRSDPGDHPFFRVEGAGIHEVAVGPVHAGIIEPGHFRFQCSGETVHHLEIQLGYQHRGAESLFLRSAPNRRLVVAESIAGDTSIGHGIAYCAAMEALSGREDPLGSQLIRGIALELERLSNHTGDLGALCNDVGYLPGASWFGRLRGEFLNLLMDISGNRFGRGLLKIGGVRFGIDSDQRKNFAARLIRVERDLHSVSDLVFDSPSVTARFERTGIVSSETAKCLGLVGPAARASGHDIDIRRDHPTGIYRYAYIPVAIVETGDVLARALVRWLEIRRSLTFLREQLAEMRDLPLSVPAGPLRSNSMVVSMVEGWRGEIAHAAVTDAKGNLAAYKIVDPSFHNWFGLAQAMREQEISDFPLCNKSFNLSYAGHDL